MKRALMVTVLIVVVLGLSSCFLLLANDPEVHYVVTSTGSQLINITYTDKDFDLQSFSINSDYFETSFTVPATEDFLAFIQADAGAATLSVYLYVDDKLKRWDTDTTPNPSVSAAYLLTK